MVIRLSTTFGRQRRKCKRREDGEGKGGERDKRCSYERGWGLGEWDMRACERLGTDSACGMSQWVTNMLELATVPQRITRPTVGMSRITTTRVWTVNCT